MVVTCAVYVWRGGGGGGGGGLIWLLTRRGISKHGSWGSPFFFVEFDSAIWHTCRMCLQWLNFIAFGGDHSQYLTRGYISFCRWLHSRHVFKGFLFSPRLRTWPPFYLWHIFLSFPNQINFIISSLPCLYTNIYTGYIGEFEIVDDHRAQKIVIELNGRLNKCGVISPRFDVAVDEIEKWIVSLLPSRQFGHIILSTTYGIMTHEEARRKKTGGKILGFFYWRACLPLNKRKKGSEMVWD